MPVKSIYIDLPVYMLSEIKHQQNFLTLHFVMLPYSFYIHSSLDIDKKATYPPNVSHFSACTFNEKPRQSNDDSEDDMYTERAACDFEYK